MFEQNLPQRADFCIIKVVKASIRRYSVRKMQIGRVMAELKDWVLKHHGNKVMKATKSAAADFGINWKTLYAWISKHRFPSMEHQVLIKKKTMQSVSTDLMYIQYQTHQAELTEKKKKKAGE